MSIDLFIPRRHLAELSRVRPCWNQQEVAEASVVELEDGAVKDVNGKVLVSGDTVVVVKDLPVKGAPKPVKAGTKVKNIRIVDGEHNIACKIDGFGAYGPQVGVCEKGLSADAADR
jgi:protein PhnA